MSVAVANQALSVARKPETVGVSIPLDALDEPGTYICDWSGHLLRVSQADLDAGRFADVGHAKPESWTVTRISPDSRISCFDAWKLAESLGVNTDF
jgi:hypothetical protein